MELSYENPLPIQRLILPLFLKVHFTALVDSIAKANLREWHFRTWKPMPYWKASLNFGVKPNG